MSLEYLSRLQNCGRTVYTPPFLLVSARKHGASRLPGGSNRSCASQPTNRERCNIAVGWWVWKGGACHGIFHVDFTIDVLPSTNLMTLWPRDFTTSTLNVTSSWCSLNFLITAL
jgi:hypothetical protein